MKCFLGFSEQFQQKTEPEKRVGSWAPLTFSHAGRKCEYGGLKSCSWQPRGRCLVGSGIWCPVSVRTERDCRTLQELPSRELENGCRKKLHLWCWRSWE